MKKKIKVLIIILILILLFLILRSTYSKYVSEASGDVKTKIGRWTIYINDTDITDASTDLTKTFEITGDNVQWGEPQNGVRERKAAPGMTGKFFIEIVPETDVSFEYEFTLDSTNLVEKNSNLNVSKITVNSIEKTDCYYYDESENRYKYKFTEINMLKNAEGEEQTSEQRKDIITIELKWESVSEDDPRYDEYNAKDSELGMSAFRENADIKLPITIKAFQHVEGPNE